MPARIVVVHDAQDFVEAVVGGLREAGIDAIGCNTSMTALTLLEQAQRIELLVTRVDFPEPPHGVSLALMVQDRRPGTRVLFTAPERFRADTDGIGAFLPLPVTPEQVAAAARRLLDESGT